MVFAVGGYIFYALCGCCLEDEMLRLKIGLFCSEE